MDATPTEYPCKEIAGNVWYEFKVGTETFGHSGPPGLRLHLAEEPLTEDKKVLVIVDADDEPVLDADNGWRIGLVVDR